MRSSFMRLVLCRFSFLTYMTWFWQNFSGVLRSGFWPSIKAFLYQIPVLGWIIQYPALVSWCWLFNSFAFKKVIFGFSWAKCSEHVKTFNMKPIGYKDNVTLTQSFILALFWCNQQMHCRYFFGVVFMHFTLNLCTMGKVIVCLRTWPFVFCYFSGHLWQLPITAADLYFMLEDILRDVI